MTLNGAIMQLVELSEHSMMPVIFRPAIQKVIETISELEENPELHWIPVEQELPKIGEYVLCETTARYFGKYHVCKFVNKDKWVDKPHFDWDTHGFPHVIAWTRFEPYKGVTK